MLLNKIEIKMIISQVWAHLEVLQQAPAGHLIPIDLFHSQLISLQQVGNEFTQLFLKLWSHIWEQYKEWLLERESLDTHSIRMAV